VRVELVQSQRHRLRQVGDVRRFCPEGVLESVL
jgi:hypothetical protein